MEPEGADQTFNLATQVTHFSGGRITEIAWSPDGTKIAFVRGGISFGSNPVYVVNADGSSANATVISTVGGGANPTWAPDSAKIAFGTATRSTPSPDISSPATPLPGATCIEPAWSPDGSKIAYNHEGKRSRSSGRRADRR